METTKIRSAIERHGLLFLRLAIGSVFLWFGVLKFFPHSAAEDLATATLSWISFGYLDKEVSLVLLGVLECGIGISILLRRGLNFTVPLLYVQMAGTMLPLFIFPEKTWISPFMPTLEGQYIIKNAAFIASGIILGAMARGSQLITHPKVAREAKRKEKAMVK